MTHRWKHCSCPACSRRRECSRTGAVCAGLLVVLLVLFFCAGCKTGPRPQSGGGSTTTLGGAAPTSVTTTAPQNPQTPTTTTVEKTVVRDYAPVESSEQRVASSEHLPDDGQDKYRAGSSQQRQVVGSPATHYSLPATRYPVPIRETVHERATTQTGAAQDLAGIVKAWSAAGAAHYKAILWALALGLAAWSAWKRDWPLIAAVLGVGAILSFLIAWWVGPVAAGAAALVWAAFHVARAQIPGLGATPGGPP